MAAFSSEKRANIKIKSYKQKNAREIHAVTKFYISNSQVVRWKQEFKKGSVIIRDEHNCGRPVTVTEEINVKRISAVLKLDRRLAYDALASEVDISAG